MTDMRSAMQEAGIRVKSQMQIIWEHIKDNPGLHAKRVCHDLKLNKGSVSSYLAQLVGRGMLESRDEFDRFGRVRRYYVSQRMSQYELLAKPKQKAKIAVELKEVSVDDIDIHKISNSEKPAAQQQVVDTFTVAQAREMYGILHKMFGEKK